MLLTRFVSRCIQTWLIRLLLISLILTGFTVNSSIPLLRGLVDMLATAPISAIQQVHPSETPKRRVVLYGHFWVEENQIASRIAENLQFPIL